MKKERKKDFLKTTLNELNVHYNERPDRIHVGNTYRQLVNYLKKLSVGASNKVLPDFVWHLSQRQSIILMNALIQGDGSYNSNGSAGYFTSSMTLANHVQRLALHCGWSGTIKLYTGREKGHESVFKGRTITSKYDALAVRIVKKKNNPQVNHGHVHTQSRQIEEYVSYTGQVGCLEVPQTHLFFYKEDTYSPPCWTGNSSRHGQKGTIGSVVPQEDLPFTQDGISPDIIINPHAIPSRMTIGHLIEALGGKVRALTCEQISADPFAGASVDDIMDMLHNSGFNRHGDELMMNGVTGERYKAKIFIACTLYQRLSHDVLDKIHARSEGRKNMLTRQPNEGRANGGGLRFGNMETHSVTAHACPNVTLDRLLYSSDPYTMRVCPNCEIEVQNKGRCQRCNEADIKSVKTPFAFVLMCKELASMGINLKLKVS